MNTFDLLVQLRGGMPERCDFCGQPYNNLRTPEPEEAGEWACSECVARWNAITRPTASTSQEQEP